jgi:hypothetical protein
MWSKVETMSNSVDNLSKWHLLLAHRCDINTIRNDGAAVSNYFLTWKYLRSVAISWRRNRENGPHFRRLQHGFCNGSAEHRLRQRIAQILGDSQNLAPNLWTGR